ncbi:LamG-like jellyroll fold domain-containing protein [Streptomyces sp. NPDC093089]|uniref:LamG-like jellyroll fold domain-containing protein n=1 Tax=Streptomyces sp. NPDC093089 TaxID=3366024 RepID=UPI0038101BEA
MAGVRDAATNEIRPYVDGVLAATALPGRADVSTGPFAVGRAEWGGGSIDVWKGSVDGAHAFDEAFSSEEVAAPRAAGKP